MISDDSINYGWFTYNTGTSNGTEPYIKNMTFRAFTITPPFEKSLWKQHLEYIEINENGGGYIP